MVSISKSETAFRPKHIGNDMKRIILGILTIYKKMISPFLPPSCRYYPTCSDYCREAVERFGVLRGLNLGIKRLLRCHPWHPGGYDPVPEHLKSLKQNPVGKKEF